MLVDHWFQMDICILRRELWLIHGQRSINKNVQHIPLAKQNKPHIYQDKIKMYKPILYAVKTMHNKHLIESKLKLCCVFLSYCPFVPLLQRFSVIFLQSWNLAEKSRITYHDDLLFKGWSHPPSLQSWTINVLQVWTSRRGVLGSFKTWGSHPKMQINKLGLLVYSTGA